MTEPKTRTIFVEVKSGTLRRIEIPEDWHISFGPVAVGVSRNGVESPNVLRIYADVQRKNLVAVYRDVISISDARVKVTDKKVHKREKKFIKKGGNGEQVCAAEIRKTVWSDPFADEPDAEEQDFDEGILELPSSMGDDRDAFKPFGD